TGTLNGSGQATYSTSSLTAGSHVISAVYSGDANYAPSTGTLTQVVNPAATSPALVSSVNPANLGQSVPFTATPTTSAATPPGTVGCKDGAATLGTATLNGSGQATRTTTSLGGGTHPITAVYTATGNFASSTSPIVNQIVNLSGTTTTLVDSIHSTIVGQ